MHCIKKEKEAREYKGFLHTFYIICYTIFYLQMLNSHVASLKSNLYSRHDSIADTSVSSVAMLFKQEENYCKENFVKYWDWKILSFSRFFLFYGEILGVIVKGKICCCKTNVSCNVYKNNGNTGLDFETQTMQINGTVSGLQKEAQFWEP